MLKKTITSSWIITILLISFCVQTSFANLKMNPTEIRKTYLECLNSSSTTDMLLKSLNERKNESPYFLAYYGAVLGLKAKHSVNPFSKLEYLNKSKENLASAIKLDPKNIEFRFLRFSMEHYIPEWLGYSGNLKNDKAVILENLPLFSDKEIKKVILGFLKESKRLTPAELKLIEPLDS